MKNAIAAKLQSSAISLEFAPEEQRAKQGKVHSACTPLNLQQSPSCTRPCAGANTTTLGEELCWLWRAGLCVAEETRRSLADSSEGCHALAPRRQSDTPSACTEREIISVRNQHELCLPAWFSWESLKEVKQQVMASLMHKTTAVVPGDLFEN